MSGRILFGRKGVEGFEFKSGQTALSFCKQEILHRFGAMIPACACLIVASTAPAQVASQDSNYTPTLFASGPQLPVNMVFRPGTNDLLVTEEAGVIKRVDGQTGMVTVFASVPPDIPPDRGQYTLYGIGADSGGNVFTPALVTLPATTPILEFDASGRVLNRLAFPGRGLGVAVDSSKNVYVTSQPVLGPGTGAEKIYEYAPPYTSPPTLFAGGFSDLQTIAFNAAGDLFGADLYTGTVYKITPGGMTAASHTIVASGISQAFSLAIDPISQTIFVGNRDGTVKHIDTSGHVSVFASGFSNGSDNATAFDSSGNLYVADQFTSAVWKFTHIVGTTISPASGGNAGRVTVQIVGTTLQSGATVQLINSGSTITGANTTLSSPSVLQTTFDLTSASPTVWDVVITNPDGSSLRITQGFTITPGGQANVSVDIVGLSEIRIGTAQSYYIALQNSGNIDSRPNQALVTVPAYLVLGQSNQTELVPAGILPDATPPTSQTATFITAGVPAGQTQYASFQITDPFSVTVSGFTITGKQLLSGDEFPDSLYDYATAHGAEYPWLLLPSTTCPSDKNTAVDVAFAAADAKYGALQSAQDAVNSQLVLMAGSATKVIAQATLVQVAGLEELGSFALDLSINILRACFGGGENQDLTNPNDQSCLANSEAILDAWAGVIVSGYGPTVSKLVTLAQAAATANSPSNISTLNSLVSEKQTALSSFYNSFQQYVNALSQFSACSGYTPLPTSNSVRKPSLTVTPVASLDPNAISGPQGFGNQHFVNASGELIYAIEFTNETAATAPANTVTVVEPLPPSVNLDQYSFGPLTLLDQTIMPPLGAGNTFTTFADLRPAVNVIARINASLNPATAVATWTFTSLDPATLLPESDPTQGLLPPDASGSVSFLLKPSANTPTGYTISNQATITFDANPAIATGIWSNAIDGTPPTSRVTRLSGIQNTSCFAVQWLGADVGSGIQGFDVFVADNGAAYLPWQMQSTESTSIFRGQPAHSYSFYSQAVDFVGNIEAAKSSADASTSVPIGASCNGRPAVSGIVTTKSSTGTTETLTIQLTNTGVGDSPIAVLNGVTFRTLSGSGQVALIGPSVPIMVGRLNAGANTSVQLNLNVPTTVKEFMISEEGSIQDLAGSSYSFSIGQTVFQ